MSSEYIPPAVLLFEETGIGIVFSNLTALPLFCARPGLAINSRAGNAAANQERRCHPSLLSICWFLPRFKARPMSRDATFAERHFAQKFRKKGEFLCSPPVAGAAGFYKANIPVPGLVPGPHAFLAALRPYPRHG